MVLSMYSEYGITANSSPEMPKLQPGSNYAYGQLCLEYVYGAIVWQHYV